MKNFFEIIAGKNFRELTSVEKDMVQVRQTELVCLWQDEQNPSTRELIEEELYASFRGLVKAMAFRQSEKSFSVEEEDFQGMMYLVLTESMIKYDRTLNLPFQPFFITNVKNEIKMMYRQKGYDLHDTTDKLDNPGSLNGKRIYSGMQTGDTLAVTLGDLVAAPQNPIEDKVHEVATEYMLDDCFNGDEKKKTIIHMYLQDFKRNEIVSAINTEGKSHDAIARLINRTVTQFKAYYLNFTYSEAN